MNTRKIIRDTKDKRGEPPKEAAAIPKEIEQVSDDKELDTRTTEDRQTEQMEKGNTSRDSNSEEAKKKRRVIAHNFSAIRNKQRLHYAVATSNRIQEQRRSQMEQRRLDREKEQMAQRKQEMLQLEKEQVEEKNSHLEEQLKEMTEIAARLEERERNQDKKREMPIPREQRRPDYSNDNNRKLRSFNKEIKGFTGKKGEDARKHLEIFNTLAKRADQHEDQDKIELFKTTLSEDAWNWWTVQGKYSHTWKECEQSFKREFLDQREMETNLEALLQIKQKPGEDVTQLGRRIQYHASLAGKLTPHQICLFFRNALRSDIAIHVKAREFSSIQEDVTLAQRWENSLQQNPIEHDLTTGQLYEKLKNILKPEELVKLVSQQEEEVRQVTEAQDERKYNPQQQKQHFPPPENRTANNPQWTANQAYERPRGRGGAFGGRGATFGGRGDHGGGRGNFGGQPRINDEKVCSGCGKRGHNRSECYTAPCDFCKEEGHNSSGCKKAFSARMNQRRTENIRCIEEHMHLIGKEDLRNAKSTVTIEEIQEDEVRKAYPAPKKQKGKLVDVTEMLAQDQDKIHMKEVTKEIGEESARSKILEGILEKAAQDNQPPESIVDQAIPKKGKKSRIDKVEILWNKIMEEQIMEQKIEIPLKDLMQIQEFKECLTKYVAADREHIFNLSQTRDTENPSLTVHIKGHEIENTIIDAGAGPNIMPFHTYKKLGLKNLMPAEATLTMANGTRVIPEGICYGVEFSIGKQHYREPFYVMVMEDESQYPLLLGRRWLNRAQIKWDYSNNVLEVPISGNQTVKIQSYPQKRPQREATNPRIARVEEIISEFPRLSPEHYEENEHQWRTEEFIRRIEEHPRLNFEKSVLPEEYDEILVDTVEGQNRNIKVGKNLSEEEKEQYKELFIKYKDVFAWTHSEMKGVPPEVYVHRIPLIEGAKPSITRQYKMNPHMEELVKVEIEKLIKADFIYPVEHAEWVSPVVPVYKKRFGVWKMRMAVDFRKLNNATIKDRFPIPFQDQIFDSVGGYARYSFMDGFAGYNLLAIAEEDQHKTTFTCSMGTYAYRRMPFGLSNAPSAFQRMMFIVFKDLIKKCIAIFLDDYTMYSDEIQHLKFLDKCFERCRKFGISLNPTKCLFAAPQGKVLGLIIDKNGIRPNPETIKAIIELPRPESPKQVKSYLGASGHYRRFMKNYAAVVRPVSRLLSTKSAFLWDKHCEEAFQELKKLLTEIPVLIRPDWSKPFIIHVDASQYATGAVLAQKDDQGHEHPIYYMSRTLSDAEMRYSNPERECLGVIVALKKFRTYLLLSKCIIYTDHESIKAIMNRPASETNSKLARWVMLMNEFDIEFIFKPGKLHHLPDCLSRIKGPPSKDLDDSFPDETAMRIGEETHRVGESSRPGGINLKHLRYIEEEWYGEIYNFLSKKTVPKFTKQNQRVHFFQKMNSYFLIEGILFRKGADEVMRRCIQPGEVEQVVTSMHSDSCGGHFAIKNTVRKINLAGYFWPSMSKDTAEFIKKCKPCQYYQKEKIPKEQMELIPKVPVEPFMHWGIDVIGPIKPKTARGKEYIIVATDYVTKWAEARAISNANAITTSRFIYQRLVTRFGVPAEIVTDKGANFMSEVVQHLTMNYDIWHSKSSPYYPRCNGQAERTNGILGTILKKTVQDKGVNWDLRLHAAIWAYNTAYKVTTGFTPSFLVYGKEAVLPLEIAIPNWKHISQKETGEVEAITERLHQIELLEEERDTALHHRIMMQNLTKIQHDKKVNKQIITEGMLVLVYDSRKSNFPGKFAQRWLGPYVVQKAYDNNTYKVVDLQGSEVANVINGAKLKAYRP